MISNWAIDHKPVSWQHREFQKQAYKPSLRKEKRATILGGDNQLLVRTAYVSNMTEGNPKDANRLTGLWLPNPEIAQGVPMSIKRHARSQFVVGNCGGNLAVGVVLNLIDQTDLSPVYGNPHASFQYDFIDGEGLPPAYGYSVQVPSHPPFYSASPGHHGGDVAMILRSQNIRTGDFISLVVRLYGLAAYQSVILEKPVRTEPNNGGLHMTGHIGEAATYLTMDKKSAISQSSRGKSHTFTPHGDTFRFQVNRKDFLAMVFDAEAFLDKSLGHPDDWRLGSVTMNYELSGKKKATDRALMAGSHSGLRVWV